MRVVLGLAHKGIPWDVIMAWDYNTRIAATIIIGELESGKSFNFATKEWPGDNG